MNEHDKTEVTKNELFFPHVVVRLKDSLKLGNDAALADALGLSRSNFANKKSSGAVPYEQVICLCKAKGLDLEWILFGTESKVKKNERLQTIQAGMCIGPILTELSQSFERAVKEAPDSWRGCEPTLSDLGTLAGNVYDRLKWSNPDDLKGIHAAIKAEAAVFVTVFRLLKSTDKYKPLAADEDDLKT